MDIQALAALVVQKFKEAGGYSELPDKDLYKSIHGCLNDVYRRNFDIVQKKIKYEESCGIFPDKDRYESAYTQVEDIVMAHANKLAATDKAEL